MAQQEVQSLSPSNFAMSSYPANQRYVSKRDLFPSSNSPPPEITNRLLHHLLNQNKNSAADVDMCCVTGPDRDSPDLGNRDDESENTNDGGTTTGKKKGKAQKFYCDDFPPCNLSFTRSEHLARHIRKHTGERPFQCHCSRRFSRLDNLRQHAQTVHQNEEIPEDSLAATGTRFQRQVRNTIDKSRPSGARARGNTVGSQATTSNRVHKRNSLSTSSIGSVSSYSSNQTNPDRKKPLPLILYPSNTTTGEYANSKSSGRCLNNKSSHSSNGGATGLGDGHNPIDDPLSNTPHNKPGSHLSLHSSHGPHPSSSPGPGNTSSSLAGRSNDFANPAWATVTGLQSPPVSSHSRTASESPWSHLPRPSRRLSVPIPLGTPQMSSSTPSLSSSSSSLSSNSMQLSSLLSDGPVNVPSDSSHPNKGTTSSPTAESTRSLVWTLRDNVKERDESNRRRTWHPDSNMSLNLPGRDSSPRILKNINPSKYPDLDPTLHPPQISISSPHPPQSSPPPQTPMRLPGIESFGPLETSQPSTRHESNIFHILESPSRSLWSIPSRESRNPPSHSPQLDHVINRNMYRLELTGQEAINSWILDHHVPPSQRENVEALSLPMLRGSPCNYEYPEINAYNSPMNILKATCRK